LLYAILITPLDKQMMSDYKVAAAYLSRLWRAAISVILVMALLAGCGEQVTPTITPQAGALNFFFFLQEGAASNAEAYWLPQQLSDADAAKIKQAADTLSPRQFRNPKASSAIALPVTPSPDRDQGATVSITLTAELQQADGSWGAAAPVLQAQMTSTSIGWRVRDFSLLDAATKKGDY
jgi:hypothetical protein